MIRDLMMMDYYTNMIAMGFYESVKHVLTSIFDWDSCSARVEFWWYQLFRVICAATMFGLVMIVAHVGNENILKLVTFVVGIPVLTALFYVCIAEIPLEIRRMHDIDKSGWWILVRLIPYVGGLIFLYLACQPSDPYSDYLVDDDSLESEDGEGVVETEKTSKALLWIVFACFLLATLSILFIGGYSKKENDEWKSVAESISDDDAKESKSTQQNELEPNYTMIVVVANPNEVSDGRIAIRKIKGVMFEEIYSDDTNKEVICIDAYDDTKNPSYGIRISSCYVDSGLGYNMYELFNQLEETRELKDVHHTSSEREAENGDGIHCYIVSRVYETNPFYVVDIAIISYPKLHKLCVAICERSKGTKTPFDEIVKNIRFE